MTSFVALLRAVNVGGTGKLPMSDLKEFCEELGFGAVRTYIASGNLVQASAWLLTRWFQPYNNLKADAAPSGDGFRRRGHPLR